MFFVFGILLWVSLILAVWLTISLPIRLLHWLMLEPLSLLLRRHLHLLSLWLRWLHVDCTVHEGLTGGFLAHLFDHWLLVHLPLGLLWKHDVCLVFGHDRLTHLSSSHLLLYRSYRLRGSEVHRFFDLGLPIFRRFDNLLGLDVHWRLQNLDWKRNAFSFTKLVPWIVPHKDFQNIVDGDKPALSRYW